MKRLLSQYWLSYPRSLVYMLQTCEYYILDYLEWFYLVDNFNNVEKAGKLKLTKKAILLLVLAWSSYLIMIAGLVWFTIAGFTSYGYYPLLGLLFLPYLLAYLMTVPVITIKYLIQLPIEIAIADSLRKRISAHPAKKIAIAGSYGKTTMREILATVLGSSKKVAAPGGSLNTLWGIHTFMKSLKGDEEIIVFELGEYYPGDVIRLARIVQPDLGVITGINEAHLKRFKSLDNTIDTIYELVDYLGDKPVYINGDNKLARDHAKGNYTMYSAKGVGQWIVEQPKSDLSGTDFILKKGKNKLSLHSDLLGLHLVGSLAASVDMALSFGFTEADIVEGVANTKPFARRLENISTDGNIVILDDSYNGNPDGVAAVISFLAGVKGYRRHYVTSGLVEMGDKNKTVHLDIAKQLVEAKIEKVMMVKNSSTAIIGQGLEKYHYPGVVMWYDSMSDIRNALPQLLANGDLVLLQTDWPDQYR